MLETKLLPYTDELNIHVAKIQEYHWFRAADVARAVGIVEIKLALDLVEPDEKTLADWRDDFGQVSRQPFLSAVGVRDFIGRGRPGPRSRFDRWLSKDGLRQTSKLLDHRSHAPRFVARYAANADRVTPGYFSVINEFMVRVWGPLEHLGHQIGDYAPDGRELRPDISVGRGFADFLRALGKMPSSEQFYPHFSAEREFPARQYPIDLMSEFHRYLHEVWIPTKAEIYFQSRDPAAIPYIAKIKRRISAVL